MTDAWVTGKYPGGSIKTTGSAALAFKTAPRILVIHSTETDSIPVYPKNFEPHVTADWRKRTWQQHKPLTEAAYALKAPAGISTNTWGAIQVEVVGRAATLEQDIDDASLAWLGGLLKMLADETAIPIQSSVRSDGGAAYGINGSVRLTKDQWYAYHGFLAHQNVPGNLHWDAGRINWSRWMAATGGGTVPVDNPVPVPDGKPRNADGSYTLVVDGIRGGATVARWQEVMATPIDGVISKPSTLIEADQRFLNSVVGTGHIQNLTGKPWLAEDGIEGRNTIIVRQFWLRNAINPVHQQNLNGHLLAFDGILGPDTNRCHQFALNNTTSGSRRYGQV